MDTRYIWKFKFALLAVAVVLGSIPKIETRAGAPGEATAPKEASPVVARATPSLRSQFASLMFHPAGLPSAATVRAAH